MAKGPYSRIYHCLREEYPTVWQSNDQLATFLRLLVEAEKWYPQKPSIPSRTRAYIALVEEGLIIETPYLSTYSVKGLDPERERRSEAGRIGAAMRWAMRTQSERNAGGNANAMPRREKNRREENGAMPHEARPSSPSAHKPGYHDGSHPPSCMVCHPVTVPYSPMVDGIDYDSSDQ